MFGGPSFLKEFRELSIEKIDPVGYEVLPKEKSTTGINVNCNGDTNSVNNVTKFENYSSYVKLIRVFKWINRFIKNVKTKI